MVPAGGGGIARAAVCRDPFPERVRLAHELAGRRLFTWKLGLNFHTGALPFRSSISYPLSMMCPEVSVHDCRISPQRHTRVVSKRQPISGLNRRKQRVWRACPMREAQTRWMNKSKVEERP